MTAHEDGLVTGPGEGLAPVMERNIEALVERRRASEQARRAHDRAADRITGFTGSLRFVVVHVAAVVAWVVVNAGWVGLRPFDPTFVVLATAASVEAIFLSTFVLISQNRMQAMADERAELDLQVTLLAEHEVTRLISLVSAVAERLGVEEAADPELQELARDVAPEQVLDQLETHRERPRHAG